MNSSPGTPAGTGWRWPSRTYAWALVTGRPIVGVSEESDCHAVAYTVASVGPYALTTRAPGTALRSDSNTLVGNASPASTSTSASTSRPGPSSRLANTDGTPLARLPRQGRSARTSRFGTSSMLPPATSGAKISNTETSKFIDVDARTRDSRPPKFSAAQCIRFTALWCDTMTPLGRPVDPEVWITYARWSARSGSSRSASVTSAAGPVASTMESSTQTGRTSSRISVRRSSGYAGSTGTYPPPALRTASAATTRSGD